MLTPFGSLPNPAEHMMLGLRWKGDFGGQVSVNGLCLLTERCRARFTEAQTDGKSKLGMVDGSL